MIGCSLLWVAVQLGAGASSSSPSTAVVMESAQALVAAHKHDDAIALLCQAGQRSDAQDQERAAMIPLLRQLANDPATSPRAAGIAADTAESFGDRQATATAASLLRWSKARAASGDIAQARALALRAASYDGATEAAGYADELAGRDLYGAATGMWMITAVSAITGASGLFVASSADANLRGRQHDRSDVDRLLAARSIGSITTAVGGIAAITAGIAAVAVTLLHDPEPEPVLPAPLQPLNVVEVQP